MDKHELSIKIEQLNKLVRKGDYVNAAKVADQLEWKKMKQWSVMSNAIDAYIAVGKYDKARNVCIYAYNRNLGGRRLLAVLTEMYIKLKDYDEAADVYREFIELAPRDSAKYTLLYKLRKAQGAPVGELIDILEEYKENELDEKYAYELATLYSEAGLADRCVKECDDMVLWFSEGVYVEKALRLKKVYAPLTKNQEEKLARLERISSLGLDYNSVGEEDTAGSDSEDTDEVYSEPIAANAEEAVTESEEIVTKARELEPEESEEEQILKLSNILSIIPDGFKNKVKSVTAKDIKNSLDKPKAQAVTDKSLAETDMQTAVKAAAHKAADTVEEVKVLDSLENTTSWVPVVPEDEAESMTDVDDVFSAVKSEEVQEIVPDNIAIAEEAASQETDIDDIEIEIKDYSVYDTRNLQQELKASMEELMEAYQNREEHEAKLDYGQDEAEAAVSSDDPTKEIVINNRPWRKASRNQVHSGDAALAATTVLNVDEVKAGLAKAEDVQETVDDQIEGQMDIMQWLAELEEEEQTGKVEKIEDTQQDDIQPEAVEEVVEEVVEPVSESDAEAAVCEEVVISEEADVSEEAVTSSEAKIAEAVASKPTSRDEEMAAIRELAAALEEAVVVKKQVVVEPSDVDAEEVVSKEDEIKEENVQEAISRESFETVVEESTEDSADESEDGQADEVDFEEIPEVDEEIEGESKEEAEEEAEWQEEPDIDDDYEAEEEELDEASDEDDEFPDLDEAITAGIDKMIDDTMNRVVAERDVYEDIANYVLQPEERKFLGKYLYMNGMESHLSDFIGEKRLLKSDGTSSSGNAAVMGNKSTDKTAFAVNLIKAIHAFDEAREQTIARTTAENLNAKGISTVKKKLLGGTLIIENAGKLIRERITDLVNFMNSETQGTLIIIADEEFSINKIFMENPDFAAMFTGRFLLKQYSVNELVAIAKDYAQENGWKIEDKALLKLYLIFSRLHNDDQGNIVLAVKDIMDTAADNAGRHIGNRLFKKVRQTLTIKEADFEEVDEDDEE